MSQFSLKMDIADNRFFTAEPSPLFSRAEAQKARAFHKNWPVMNRPHCAT